MKGDTANTHVTWTRLRREESSVHGRALAPAAPRHATHTRQGAGYQRPAKRTENRQKYTTLYKSFWSKMKIQVAAVSEPRGQTRDVYVF
jgi:hypothetical protein